jgi:hypothetical protein
LSTNFFDIFLLYRPFHRPVKARLPIFHRHQKGLRNPGQSTTLDAMETPMKSRAPRPLAVWRRRLPPLTPREQTAVKLVAGLFLLGCLIRGLRVSGIFPF